MPVPVPLRELLLEGPAGGVGLGIDGIGLLPWVLPLAEAATFVDDGGGACGGLF